MADFKSAASAIPPRGRKRRIVVFPSEFASSLEEERHFYELVAALFEFGFQWVTRYKMDLTLDSAARGAWWVIGSVGGERAFRRRLLELGLLPGTRVRVVRVAPMGDPMELEVRGTNLSIRHNEARQIVVSPLPDPQ